MPTVTTHVLFFRELCAKLTEIGWDVHLICSGQHVAKEYSHTGGLGATLHVVEIPRGMNPLDHFFAVWHLRRIIRHLAPSVIHVHAASAVFTSALARINRFAPTIATIHGINSAQMQGAKRFLVRLAETWCFPKMDTVYLVNTADVRYVRDCRLPGNFRRYQEHALGCDLDRFNRATIPERIISELRLSLNLSPTDFVFTFVGRQTYFKGFGAVIRAFFILFQTCPNVRLLLVGVPDPLHPTGLTAEEEKLLRTHPGIIHGGWRNDVQNCLAISQVNVFPSEREGLPVNIMESLAMGVPVVTIASRGCADLVQNDVNGIVLSDVHWVSDLNPMALSMAMASLNLNRPKWQHLCAGALASRARFDRNLWDEEQIAIYQHFVNARPSAPNHCLP